MENQYKVDKSLNLKESSMFGRNLMTLLMTLLLTAGCGVGANLSPETYNPYLPGGRPIKGVFDESGRKSKIQNLMNDWKNYPSKYKVTQFFDSNGDSIGLYFDVAGDFFVPTTGIRYTNSNLKLDFVDQIVAQTIIDNLRKHNGKLEVAPVLKMFDKDVGYFFGPELGVKITGTECTNNGCTTFMDFFKNVQSTSDGGDGSDSGSDSSGSDSSSPKGASDPGAGPGGPGVKLEDKLIPFKELDLFANYQDRFNNPGNQKLISYNVRRGYKK